MNLEQAHEKTKNVFESFIDKIKDVKPTNAAIGTMWVGSMVMVAGILLESHGQNALMHADHNAYLAYKNHIVDIPGLLNGEKETYGMKEVLGGIAITGGGSPLVAGVVFGAKLYADNIADKLAAFRSSNPGKEIDHGQGHSLS